MEEIANLEQLRADAQAWPDNMEIAVTLADAEADSDLIGFYVAPQKSED